MAETDAEAGTTAADDRAGSPASREDLQAEIAQLAEENDRLRRAYAETKRTTYRRTAIGMAALGVLAIAGGAVFPSARQVLFVLGAIGLFGAVLTMYVTPERFVPASVGRPTYVALAENQAALASELGLAETHRYVPVDGSGDVRLFVPQTGVEEVPDPSALEPTIVVTDEGRGLALDPTGAGLLDSLGDGLPRAGPSTPESMAEQLSEALVEQFELVRSAEPDVDSADGRATIAVADSAYGPVDRFDHPVASLLAVGFVRALDRPVELSVDPVTGDGADFLVTCRWDVTDDETA